MVFTMPRQITGKMLSGTHYFIVFFFIADNKAYLRLSSWQLKYLYEVSVFPLIYKFNI